MNSDLGRHQALLILKMVAVCFLVKKFFAMFSFKQTSGLTVAQNFAHVVDRFTDEKIYIY